MSETGRHAGYEGRIAEQSGRLHEASVLGIFKKDNPSYIEALEREKKKESSLSFEDAVAMVEKHTSDDPTNPEKSFLRDLRIAVTDILEKALAKELDPEKAVKAYTAVGTPLDIFYGTDGFLTIQIGPYKEIITIDASVDPEKTGPISTKKADVVIGDLPDANEDADAYLAAVDAYAAKIRTTLQEHFKSRPQTRNLLP